VYHYAVRAIGRDGREGRRSPRVRTQPRIVEEAVVSVVSPREARLSWTPPEGPDIAGYHVERAIAEVLSEDQVLRQKKQASPLAEPSVGAIRALGPFSRLTPETVPGHSFPDPALALTRPEPTAGENQVIRRFRDDQPDPKGKPYRFAVYVYRIRAVNALGVEGGDAPFVPTIPSAPQWLFSREEGRA